MIINSDFLYSGIVELCVGNVKWRFSSACVTYFTLSGSGFKEVRDLRAAMREEWLEPVNGRHDLRKAKPALFLPSAAAKSTKLTTAVSSPRPNGTLPGGSAGNAEAGAGEKRVSRVFCIAVVGASLRTVLKMALVD
jgi:hypothetical protein